MSKTLRTGALVLVISLTLALALPPTVAARGAVQDPDGTPCLSAIADAGIVRLERGPDQDPNGLRVAPGSPGSGVAVYLRSLIDSSLSV
jgi:hypothetical protein